MKPLIEEWPEVITPDGEVISREAVEFAYSRLGRKEVGKEYPNPVPLEPPIGFVQDKPLYEQIRDMVRRELSVEAGAQGHETFEEADDFEIGDDFDPSSPFEEVFEPTAPWPPQEPAAPPAAPPESPPANSESSQPQEGGGGSEAPQAVNK